MIIEAIWFALACWLAGIVLQALKLDKPAIAFACGGIPLHELSHLVACLALGVRVRSITLLHVDEAWAGGNVEPRDEMHNPFTVLVVSLAPTVGAVFWTLLFAWGVAAVSDLGYDQAYLLILRDLFTLM